MRKLLCIFMLCASTATAQPPLPADQWTDEARLWLARAFVAEADWHNTLDHTLIGWALVYNWRSQRLKRPDLTFEMLVRRYCTGLREDVEPSRRQTWVRSLPALGVDALPELWPGRYSWPRHLAWWRDVQAFVERWGAGAVRDPSKGRVRHWGSASPELPDITKAQQAVDDGRWVLLVTPGTKNLFYGHAR